MVLSVWLYECVDVNLCDCKLVFDAVVTRRGSQVARSTWMASRNAHTYCSVWPSPGAQITRLQGLNVVLSSESWKATWTHLWIEKTICLSNPINHNPVGMYNTHSHLCEKMRHVFIPMGSQQYWSAKSQCSNMLWFNRPTV